MPITINGTTGIAGVDGSAGTPAVQGADTNTGMFFPAADTIAFAEGGAEVLRINSSAQVEFQDGTASLPTVTNSGDLNTGFYFPEADGVSVATGGSERFRVGPSGQFGIGGATYGTSGQVLTSGGSGAAPSWSTKGMTLITSLATTSGTNPVASGLTLTPYKQLVLVFEGVGQDSGASRTLLIGTSTADDIAIMNSASNTGYRGFLFIDLTTGVSQAAVQTAGANSMVSTNTMVGDLPITTASTSISVALSSTGNFNAGSISIYGQS